MKYSKTEMIGASALIAVWLVFGANTVGDMLVRAKQVTPPKPAAPSMAKPAAPSMAKETQTAGAPADAQAGTLALLASADAGLGKTVFKKCQSCHTADQGGKNRVGPNLWSVVGRPKAAHPGFKYSGALTGLGGQWSYADLDAFLTSPKAFAKGNKMTFKGLAKAAERAALIAFLRGQSDSPPPLP